MFKVTEIGSFEVRYDIQPDLLFEMLYEKIEEVRERKDLIHHLIRRESYLKPGISGPFHPSFYLY